MKKIAVILAGGSGMRAGGGIPKQFRMLGGKPMILYSMQAFVRADASTCVLLVVHRDWMTHLRRLLDEYTDVPPYEMVAGGKSRIESVYNGLKHLGEPGADVLIAVHDAARPLVSPALIKRGWLEGAECGAVVPVIPLADSIREIATDTLSQPRDRSRYRLVQTPQVFDIRILMQAYAALNSGDVPDFLTDDASVVEHGGGRVRLYDGEPENMKVTNPSDFAVAEGLLSLRNE